MKPRVYYRPRLNDFVAYLNHPTLGTIMGWSGTSAKQAIRDCEEQIRRRISRLTTP